MKGNMERDASRQFGEYIRRVRQEQKLSIRELASRTGIDSGALTRIEHGKVRIPRPETLKALAAALDVPLPDMFARAGYATPHELPDMTTYLQLRYGHLPENVRVSIEHYIQWLMDRYGASGGGTTTRKPINHRKRERKEGSFEQHHH